MVMVMVVVVVVVVLLLLLIVVIMVVLAMVLNLRGVVMVSGLLPLAVLMCFVAMKVFGVDANIVALSGIAIAIGTMVDMGIVISENILRHLEQAEEGEDRFAVVFSATSEVGGAVLTAVLTTVVGFLPRPIAARNALCAMWRTSASL